MRRFVVRRGLLALVCGAFVFGSLGAARAAEPAFRKPDGNRHGGSSSHGRHDDRDHQDRHDDHHGGHNHDGDHGDSHDHDSNRGGYPYLGRYKAMYRSTYSKATSNFFSLGRATSSEFRVRSSLGGFNMTGTCLPCERGTIYRADYGRYADNPFIVSGSILREYKKYNAHGGRLGFPIGPRFDLGHNDGYMQKFQAGVIKAYRNGHCDVDFNNYR
ncbi:MAG: hypothetical protein JNK76_03955 [Planctomycetales bacterium]|nr:hypothetical protein [Planctomycetales bacterium]MBN8624229.1 hypothetical protein [Planctomycetota bacterium]